MPITQSRLADLLHAAQDYQLALTNTCELVRAAVTEAQAGSITPQQAFAQIRTYTSHTLGLSDAAGSASTIACEAARLRLSWRNNERGAERQRRKRRAQGIPARAELPPPLSPPSASPAAQLIKQAEDDAKAEALLQLDSSTLDPGTKSEIDRLVAEMSRGKA